MVVRLHFNDNTIQDDGIFTGINSNNQIQLGHINIKNYFNYKTSLNPVIGNTAALMMIRKKVFESCGFFNENYLTCFEDVELNFMLVTKGLINYCDSSLVSYHFESQTRSEDTEKQKNEFIDYNKLIPFISNNIRTLKSMMINI